MSPNDFGDSPFVYLIAVSCLPSAPSRSGPLGGVLAEEAKKIVSTFSDVISVNILDAEQCKELKMGAYLSVAAATTENPPYFIHLCFKTLTNEHKRKIALVGKGLTFDSGGYNLKTGAGSKIELMKYDMGGAAVVLGATKALGEIRPFGVEVHFIVAACENMISGAGMRPGDIVTASNEIHFINLLIMELASSSSSFFLILFQYSNELFNFIFEKKRIGVNNVLAKNLVVKEVYKEIKCEGYFCKHTFF
uniref:Leucine aminopeptidase, chloroplastic n=1 Tax=Solanum tuberosum TaxID=4113 RepID=M1ANC4_SOLTU